MAVLGIFMSLSDAPGAIISTDTAKFDTEVCDFAWHLPNTTSVGRFYTFSHEEAAGNVTWHHFAQISNAQLAADDGALHKILDAGGNTIFIIDLVDGNMRLQVIGSTTEYSETAPVPVTLTRFDIKIDFTTGITVDLHLDGSPLPTLSVNTAGAGTRTKPVSTILQTVDADNVYVSEFYVADFDTRNTRPVKQMPNAVGNYSAWNGGYAEMGDEDEMTAADGVTAGDKVSVNLETYPGPGSVGGIKMVVMKIVGSKGATGPQDIDPFVRIAGTDYSAGNIGVTETPLSYYAEFANNPNTSVPWTTGDLDTTELGLEAKT